MKNVFDCVRNEVTNDDSFYHGLYDININLWLLVKLKFQIARSVFESINLGSHVTDVCKFNYIERLNQDFIELYNKINKLEEKTKSLHEVLKTKRYTLE